MERQRWKDGLVGAASTVLVLLVSLALFLWWVSEPVGDDPAPAAPPPTASADGRPAAEPPSDLVAGETWLGDVVLDAGTVVTPDAVLRDVTAAGQDVRAGPAGLVAGSLSVDATVPFEVVADELGDGVRVTRAGDSQASVVRTVEFAGRQFRVVATGSVEVAAGRLVVEPRSIDIGGPAALSDAIAAVARRLVTIEHRVEGLPHGLVLQDVTVQDDGFRAVLRGEKVRLVS